MSVEHSDENKTQKRKLVVTTTHIRDLVERITANRFDIIPLMGPGVDPHIYKPTSRDILALSKADLVIFHGLKFEGRLSDALSKQKNSDIRTYALTTNLPSAQIIFSGGKENELHADPHIWFDPKIWTRVADEFTKVISKFDPSGKEIFYQNLLAFNREISEVESWAITQINRIPKSQRKLITSHDAFQYFGRAMGISVLALQGLSTSTEAGLGDRANLVDLINEQKISAVFIESSVNPDAINEIAKECNVIVGGELFSDSLGPNDHFSIGPNGQSFPTDTWSGMMIHNINTIVGALIAENE